MCAIPLYDLVAVWFSMNLRVFVHTALEMNNVNST